MNGFFRFSTTSFLLLHFETFGLAVWMMGYCSEILEEDEFEFGINPEPKFLTVASFLVIKLEFSKFDRIDKSFLSMGE